MDDVLDPARANALAIDAGAFLQQMDLVQRRALFVRITEAELRAASFLDERLGLQGRDGFWVPLPSLADVVSAMVDRTPVADCIFHIGHCGSTLLSRLLDQDERVLGLREPLVLRELAAAERDLETPMARFETGDWLKLFLDSLAVLGRRFVANQRVIIKATSNCNNLIEPLLAHEPSARIVLMTLPLESYLATMMKAPGGGLDALHAAPARLGYLQRALGNTTLRLHHFDTVETVAMGWVAEQVRFQRIVAAHVGTGRVMTLDFEALLADPGTQLDRIRRHFGLPGNTPDTATLMQSAVMRGYAKSPSHAYSPDDRAHDLGLSRRKFADQIGRGLRWAEAMLGQFPQIESLRPLLR